MSNFSSQCVETAATPPDSRKHVNFITGMVLGVEDLQQEFAYHQYQNHWLARDTIGYGTLSGLKVEATQAQISVAPGTALSPRGQLIRVTPRQCASLDAWLRLAETQQRLTELGVGAAGSFTTYVVLCFRDCQTDPLPIPGEPCRCDSEAMAASRITDDFRLELRFDPPVQREEEAIRDFVTWLRQIRTTGADSGYASVTEFLDAIRTAAQNLSSPLESPPDFLYGSPPETLVLPCCHLCDYLRAALHLWVTELRPMWQARWQARTGGGCGCHGEEQDGGLNAEECLLLAALRVTLGSSTSSIAGVEVDESHRPLVVHLRMLQELLLCGQGAACCNDRSFATIFALDQNTLRMWVHHPGFVSFTESAFTLEINGQALSDFTVTQVDTSGEPDSGFNHNIFDVELGASPPVPLADGQRIVARFDTRLIVENSSPPRTLAELIRHGCVCYPDLADDFITVFDAVVLPASSLILAGDATGPVHDNTVEGIQTFPVDIATPATPPGADPVLGFDGSRWHLTSQPVVPPIPQPSALLPTPVAPSPGSPGTNPTTLLEFSRADHRHPYVDPVPPHDINAGAHRNLTIAGDVTGTPANTSVVRLRGVNLSSGALGAAQEGFVLTYHNSPRQWQAEPAGARANTGLLRFEAMTGGEVRQSQEILHGLDNVLVCIRLGLEIESPTALSENTDTFFPTLRRLVPYTVAVYNAARRDRFRVVARDTRNSDVAQTWLIRWWALPIMQDLGTTSVPRDPNNPAPPDVIRIRLTTGESLSAAELAPEFGVTTAAMRTLLNRMVADGTLVTAGNSRFRLPG